MTNKVDFEGIVEKSRLNEVAEAMTEYSDATSWDYTKERKQLVSALRTEVLRVINAEIDWYRQTGHLFDKQKIIAAKRTALHFLRKRFEKEKE